MTMLSTGASAATEIENRVDAIERVMQDLCRRVGHVEQGLRRERIVTPAEDNEEAGDEGGSMSTTISSTEEWSNGTEGEAAEADGVKEGSDDPTQVWDRSIEQIRKELRRRLRQRQSAMTEATEDE